MTFNEPIALGRTGLKVGRLGIASGYGAPAEAYEEAFERGCNYWTWGTFVKGRSKHMLKALRNVAAKGERDKLVLAMFTYAHSPWLTDTYLHKGLKAAGLDHTDLLILGYYSWPPSRRILENAQRLKEKGLVRFIGLSGHDRKLVPKLAAEGVIDVFHFRYNAVHRRAETEIFPHMPAPNGPGMVSFVATAWGKLLKAEKMPPGEAPFSAPDCYRFVLSHPGVHVCMSGTKNVEQMRENLSVLESGPLASDEMARMRRVGDFIHGGKRSAKQ
ncbi:MAG: aldo/keto reductase [Acidobacteriota bacterium]|nr:aldo/keto reductase [Acidobacteriota bacterium]